MSRKLLSLFAVAVSAAACSGGVPKGSDREAAVAALQKEAEGLKRDGEKMNPALGVTIRTPRESTSRVPGGAMLSIVFGESKRVNTSLSFA